MKFVIDWAAKPEPWRSRGLRFVAELDAIKRDDWSNIKTAAVNDGENLRALREDRGWSQAQLAKRAGYHHATISDIEIGKTTPKPQTKADIATALGVLSEDIWP